MVANNFAETTSIRTNRANNYDYYPVTKTRDFDKKKLFNTNNLEKNRWAIFALRLYGFVSRPIRFKWFGWGESVGW